VAKAASSDYSEHDLELQMADINSALDSDPRGSAIDVLVVDDDRAHRTALMAILRAAGYVAEEAEDGFAALERLRSESVRSVLLEVNLPGLGGLQLLDKLDNPPPVILMSGDDSGLDVILRRSNARMFIQKPIPVPYLLEAVSQTLEAVTSCPVPPVRFS